MTALARPHLAPVPADPLDGLSVWPALRTPRLRRGRLRRRGPPRRGRRPLRHPAVRARRGGGPRALPYVPHRLPRRRRRLRGQGVPLPRDRALGAGGGPRPRRLLRRRVGARRHHRLPAGADRAARQRQEPGGPARRAAPRSRTHRRRQHLGDRPAGRVRPRPAPGRRCMVRVVPGVAAGGHTKVRTGTDDQKFGLSLTDGSAQHAVGRILDQPHLELVGLHCHIGSQITTVKPYLAAVRRMVGLMARIRRPARRRPAAAGHRRRARHRLPARRAAPRHGRAGRPGPRRAGGRLRTGRTARSPAHARARPGDRRARRGSSLYRVLAVKRTGGAHLRRRRRRHERQPQARAVRGPVRAPARRPPVLAPPRPVTVVGRHCEAGDVLADDVPLPGRRTSWRPPRGPGSRRLPAVHGLRLQPRRPPARRRGAEAGSRACWYAASRWTT